MSSQPSGMMSNKGVLLTVGMVLYEDRCACVLPLATDDGTIPDDDLCQDAVQAFNTSMMSYWLAPLCDHLEVRHLNAEGMMNGMLPWRMDFSPGTNAGHVAANGLPSQCAAQLFFYGDPADQPAGSRVKTAKTFLPGVPVPSVTGDVIDAGPLADFQVIADNLLLGWTTSHGAGKWYRVLNHPIIRTLPEPIKRIDLDGVRGNIKTQKRRTLPVV